MSGETKEQVVIGDGWKVGGGENGFLRAAENGSEPAGALLGEATAVVHLGAGGNPRTVIHRPPHSPLTWDRCLIFTVFVLFFTSAISLLLLLTSNSCDINNIGKLHFISFIYLRL